jgi:AraC-like DNA-binding protein
VRKVNDGLLMARERVPPLELQGVGVSLHHIHMGPGVFARRSVTTWHQHDEIQIEFVLEGRIRFESPSMHLELVPGRGLVTAHTVLHRWMPVTDVVMVGALLAVEGPGRTEFLALVAKHFGTDLVHLRDPRGLPAMEQAVECLLKGSLWAERMACDLVSVWLACCLKDALPLDSWAMKKAAGPPERIESRGRFLCDKALEFMTANLGQPLQLADVAVQLGVSPRHLNRLFVRHNGKSVTSTLQEIRLNRAKRLLEKDPTISVKEVSFATGFSRPSYFTHCFKKAFGRRPGDVTATRRGQ